MFKSALILSLAVLSSATSYALCNAPSAHLIDQKRVTQPSFGNPMTDYLPIPKNLYGSTGCMRAFQGGAIYAQDGASQAFSVLGLNKVKYDKLNGVMGSLGFPTSDELVAADGTGRFNTFQNGEVYWRSGANESFEIHGSILAKWKKLGGVKGTFGYPVTDESVTPDQIGRYNHFQNGSIYYRPCVGGAYQVTGLIRNRWAELGWEKGYLGYPLTDELPTSDGNGRYNRFQRGVVVWHPTYGTKVIWGKIYHKWIAANDVKGTYGYPKGELVCGVNSCSQQFSKANLTVPFSEGVDLRPEINKRNIAIRNQGPRGTCSVQTLTFLLEYAYTQMCGETAGYNFLSVEYLNHVGNKATGKTDDGDFFRNIAEGYLKYGIVRDHFLQYDPGLTYNYQTMESAIQSLAIVPMGQDLLSKLTFKGLFIKPNDGTVGLSDAQMNTIKTYLDRQIPVGIGRGHSMAVVGYELSSAYPGGGRFIFRNSYGTGTGINGYQYEDFDSVKKTTNDVYVFDIPGMRGYVPSPH